MPLALGVAPVQSVSEPFGHSIHQIRINTNHLQKGSTQVTFDLLSALPGLLPSAIAWAEEQCERTQRTGQPLDTAGLAMAARVGVQHPERIRTQLVDALPLPEEPALHQAALATGLLGPGMIGLTLGHSIFIVRGYMGNLLLSHECRHVYQYETHGSIAAFLPLYLLQIATVGYLGAPFEQDARAHELESC
jgi:hypothetical protein